MERRGIYQKGRQGHARNVSSYRLFKERIKKWRIPLTAVLAVLVFFATTPTVGDHSRSLQLSLLTAEEIDELTSLPRTEAVKRILSSLKIIMQDCASYGYSECVRAGSVLATDIVSSSREIAYFLDGLGEFSNKYGSRLAALACKKKVRDAIVSLKESSKFLEDFSQTYGVYYKAETYTLDMHEDLEALAKSLEQFVSRCDNGYNSAL